MTLLEGQILIELTINDSGTNLVLVISSFNKELFRVEPLIVHSAALGQGSISIM